MRVLITTTPCTGHYLPMVPLAWALRAAGHDVLVASSPTLVPMIRSTGLCAAPAGRPFDELSFLLSRLPEGVAPPRAWNWPPDAMASVVGRTWGILADQACADFLAVARRWRPDVVVSEPMEAAGRIVAGVLGIPAVRLGLGPEWFTGPFETTLAKYAAPALRRHGLEAGLPEPSLVLDPCPPQLQVPGVPAGRAMRFVPFNGTGCLPPADLTDPARLPRICVSLGSHTLRMNGVPLLRRVVDAVAGLGVELVVAVAAEDRVLVGEVPGWLRVVESVPLQLFLGSCDVVVHHGGSGTGMTAVGFGVPHVVLPQFADQFVFGERVVAAGLGLCLPSVELQESVSAIRGAVVRLLGDPSFGVAARRCGVEVARMPAPSDVVTDIEHLARRPGRPLTRAGVP